LVIADGWERVEHFLAKFAERVAEVVELAGRSGYLAAAILIEDLASFVSVLSVSSSSLKVVWRSLAPSLSPTSSA
jgi:hypothetical protein